jgi:diketogulonate reductase-like aldo/keto reductase
MLDDLLEEPLMSDELRYAKLPLNTGFKIPALGFGTLIPDAAATAMAVETALEAGFRHLDCAERYRNEDAVGNALSRALAGLGMRREEVFVTTKLWNNNHRPERVATAFEASRRRLKLDYVDLYLIHTPFAFAPGDEQDPRDANGEAIYDKGVQLLDAWGALERLVDAGACRAIGLSDANIEQLEAIRSLGRIKPAVIQVESHPYLPQWELLEYCRKTGIVLLAFAALGHAIEPKLLDDPVVTAIARRLNKTAAQVLLAWAVQRGTALLTTSTSPSRIRENFDISLLPEDALKQLNDEVATRYRFNSVVDTGIPGFIPREN